MSMVIPKRSERKYEPYPEHKDSAVEWLGGIPAHWGIKRLKYVADVEMGQSPSSEDYTYDNREIPFLQGNADFTELYPQAIVWCDTANKTTTLGDILLSVRAPIGAVNIADQVYGIGRGLCAIHGSNIHQGYLYYAALCLNKELNSLGTGSTYTAVSVDQVKNVVIPLPSDNEQQIIADFLDHETASIDELITKKQRLIELLQEQRTALITHAITKGINADTPMKDSGVEWLGEIPAHWEVKKLKHLVTPCPSAIKSGPFGSQLLTSDMNGSDVKVYNQRTVVDGDLDAGEGYITQEKYLELSAFTVYSGDILITTRGTIGRCAIVPQQAPLGILHPCLMRIQPDINKVLPNYLKIIIQDSILFYMQLQYYSNATTIDVVYTDTLKNIKIPLPSTTDEQQAIADYLDRETTRIDNLVGRINQAIEKLWEYRAALITAAVTGKIDVR